MKIKKLPNPELLEVIKNKIPKAVEVIIPFWGDDTCFDIGQDAEFDIEAFENGKLINKKVPMRNAMNEITRQAYVDDCNIGIKRWNRLIKKYGYEEYSLALPSTKFRRNIGVWANLSINPKGEFINQDIYNRKLASWLPSENDKKFINSLMIQELDPSKTASWITKPRRGINNQEIDYSYVDLN